MADVKPMKAEIISITTNQWAKSQQCLHFKQNIICCCDNCWVL